MEVKYANFDTMADDHYNKEKCSIEEIDTYPRVGEYIKDIVTGELSIIVHPKGYVKEYPHVRVE